MYFKDTLFLLDIKFQMICKQWMGFLKERKFCQKVHKEKKCVTKFVHTCRIEDFRNGYQFFNSLKGLSMLKWTLF